MIDTSYGMHRSMSTPYPIETGGFGLRELHLEVLRRDPSPPGEGGSEQSSEPGGADIALPVSPPPSPFHGATSPRRGRIMAALGHTGAAS
ncbi:hypothetical protein CHELA20_50549 [Hyphomicrobiales bacterium]|jgi:hypothetical protein|nr:hypothetical protein CHELA20_50549 [Hyphomicrobiales bacterium]CAH1678729.1 hypothetical protein CHELA41_24578 [Hyphomicrobiales bacterium]